MRTAETISIVSGRRDFRRKANENEHLAF